MSTIIESTNTLEYINENNIQNIIRSDVEFLVNSESIIHQKAPTITTLSNGGYVISWETKDGTQDGSSSSIKAQIYNSDGTLNGVEFLVNSETTKSQTDSEIVALSNGGFLITWTSNDKSQDGSRSAIKAQVFDNVGTSVGSEILVNTESYSSQVNPEITSLDNGGFVITWETVR